MLLLLCGLVLWRFDLAADHRIFDALRLDRDSALAPLAAAISAVSGASVLAPLGLLAVAWLYWRQRRREAFWLLIAVGTGRLAVETMKLAFAVPRPPLAGHLDHVTSWSFPSSHSAGSMLTFLALATLAGNRRGMMQALAIAAAVLVGWSRMALGVHWPSDVATGLGLGMLWIGAAQVWLLKARLPSS